MASVQKSRTASGTLFYKVTWREPGPDGNRRQRARSFETQATARAFRAKVEAEVERRNVGDAGDHDVAAFLHYWLGILEGRKEHSETTVAVYRRTAEMAIKYIGKVPLNRLSAAHLDHLYVTLLARGGQFRNRPERRRPLSATSVRAVHRTLSTALAQARRWRWIPANPCDEATPPAPTKAKVRAFSIAEVKALLAAAVSDEELYTILAVFLTVGLRRGELLGICDDAIDWQKGTLEIRRNVVALNNQPIVRMPKGETSVRTVSLPAPTLELLRRQRLRCQERRLAWGLGFHDPAFLFGAPDGSPLPPAKLSKRLNHMMKRLGIKGAACHTWRHTSATNMIDQGVSVATVSKRLGHASIQTTVSFYVHAVDERDAEAADTLGKLLERR